MGFKEFVVYVQVYYKYYNIVPTQVDVLLLPSKKDSVYQNGAFAKCIPISNVFNI